MIVIFYVVDYMPEAVASRHVDVTTYNDIKFFKNSVRVAELKLGIELICLFGSDE